MNVYDFDNTIYDGESSLDFFIFCLKRNRKMIKFVFPVFLTMIKYKLCMVSVSQLEEKCAKYLADFMKMLDNPHKTVEEFWDLHEHKIKKLYLERQREDDIIISASCDALLDTIAERLGIKNVIASKIDFENNKVIYMCFHTNKVKIFKSLYPDAVIDEFYSDSKNDIPMMKLAKKAYFVKKNKITQYIPE